MQEVFEESPPSPHYQLQPEGDLHANVGWFYFIHGWTRVMAEVFHVDIPSTGPGFDRLIEIAESIRT